MAFALFFDSACVVSSYTTFINLHVISKDVKLLITT